MDLKVKKKAKGKANHAYGIDSCVMENDIRTHNNDVPEWLMNLSHVTEKCLFLWFTSFTFASPPWRDRTQSTPQSRSTLGSRELIFPSLVRACASQKRVTFLEIKRWQLEQIEIGKACYELTLSATQRRRRHEEDKRFSLLLLESKKNKLDHDKKFSISFRSVCVRRTFFP